MAKLITKIICTLIYIIGILCVCSCIILLLSDSTTYVNPDAMLPMTKSEIGFNRLALGAIPMNISCISLYIVYGIYNTVHKRRNTFLIFIPGLICAIPFTFWLYILTIGQIIYPFLYY